MIPRTMAWAFAKELRATGDFSDISVTVEGETLNLHKFPLLATSKYFQGLVSSKMADSCSVTLDGLPGGLETMRLVANFSYNISIEQKMTCENVGPLICAASYLQMTGENNLLDVASKTFDSLRKKGALNCLQILKGCCRTAVNAESEGIVEQCATSLSYNWTRPQFTISNEEVAILQELPLRWMPTLLAKMKQNKSNPEVDAKVIAAAIRWAQADQRLLEPYNAKGSENETFSECKSEIETVFDAIVRYIPHPLLLNCDGKWKVGKRGLSSRFPSSMCHWYCKALIFASERKLTSYSKLRQYCSSLQSYLTVEHCKDFPPDLMRSINISNHDDLSNSKENKRICSLNDAYLLFRSKQGSISASDFLAVMNSVSKFRGPTSSSNDSFEAFEALLGSSLSETLSPKDIKELSNSIDFAKLSNECLQRAASNDLIPKEHVLTCVMQLCAQLRSDLNESRQLSAHRTTILVTLEEKKRLEESVHTLNGKMIDLYNRILLKESSLESLKKELHEVQKENEAKGSCLESLRRELRRVQEGNETKASSLNSLQRILCNAENK